MLYVINGKMVEIPDKSERGKRRRRRVLAILVELMLGLANLICGVRNSIYGYETGSMLHNVMGIVNLFVAIMALSLVMNIGMRDK